MTYPEPADYVWRAITRSWDQNFGRLITGDEFLAVLQVIDELGEKHPFYCQYKAGHDAEQRRRQSGR